MEKKATRYGNYGALIGGLIGATPSLIDAYGEEGKEKRKALRKALVKGVLGTGVGYAGGEVYGWGRHPLKSSADYIGLNKKDSFINKQLYKYNLKEEPKPWYNKLNPFNKKEGSFAGTVNYTAGGALIGGGAGYLLNYLKNKKRKQEDPEYQSSSDETMNSVLKGMAIGGGAGLAAKAIVPMYYKNKANKLYQEKVKKPLEIASSHWDDKKSQKNIFGKLLMGSKKRYLKKVENSLPHMQRAKTLVAGKWLNKYKNSGIYDKMTMKGLNKTLKETEDIYKKRIPNTIKKMKPFSDNSRKTYKQIKQQF